MKPSLDNAYCPACLTRLRKHTHQNCRKCEYETGGVHPWLTLREMLESEEVVRYGDCDLHAYMRLLRDALQAEHGRGE